MGRRQHCAARRQAILPLDGPKGSVPGHLAPTLVWRWPILAPSCTNSAPTNLAPSPEARFKISFAKRTDVWLVQPRVIFSKKKHYRKTLEKAPLCRRSLCISPQLDAWCNLVRFPTPAFRFLSDTWQAWTSSLVCFFLLP